MTLAPANAAPDGPTNRPLRSEGRDRRVSIVVSPLTVGTVSWVVVYGLPAGGVIVACWLLMTLPPKTLKVAVPVASVVASRLRDCRYDVLRSPTVAGIVKLGTATRAFAIGLPPPSRTRTLSVTGEGSARLATWSAIIARPSTWNHQVGGSPYGTPLPVT